jgi:hypothetical protein
MNQTIVLDPLVPVAVLWGLGIVAAVMLGFALWRGLRGWPLRALAMAALGVALLNPSLQEEDRKPLSDIILAIVDDSASQSLGDRKAQADEALSRLSAAVATLENTELRVIRFADGAEDAGSLAMTALSQALAAEPRARVAGAVIITDGQVHDTGLAPNLPAPLHVLLTGRQTDWDRRLVITDAPAFAIVGEEFTLKLRIEDQGAAPAGSPEVELTIAVDADDPVTFSVPLNTDLELPVTLPHGGQNVLQFSVAAAQGELTDRNNVAVVQINGVRDRLRVLLVSGEPHTGERVWRNLLKSDAAVDLVHFTILRPPEKQDGVPVDELALIAFPTRELFVEKINEFDLIIFDRYRMRGILPMEYIDNVVSYVRQGGTVLVAAGPEFGAVDSLWRSPLAEVLPVSPTAQVIEEPFRPALTDLGRRHPVTEGLEALAPEGGWGRWFRLAEVELLRGQVAMSGPGDRPLLVLDRVDQGRIAVLTSDQIWLWGRGFEGGGPQLELMRRLAHWMLKEPELEEEALMAGIKGDVLTLTRRTIRAEPPGALQITAPDGTVSTLTLPLVSPGRFQTEWQAPMLGLYRLAQDDLTRVVAVGPPAPKEFVETLSTAAVLQPVVDTVQGGILRLEDGFPSLRPVREGRPAAGRGWLGYSPRGAYVTEDLRVQPLVPGWLLLVLAAGLALAAWLAEGRRAVRAKS